MGWSTRLYKWWYKLCKTFISLCSEWYSLYQPIGDYATKAEVATATNDMLTKTTADSLYEPKNDDLATKTWVGQQGYLTEHQSLDGCVKHSEVYVQNGILYINL